MWRQQETFRSSKRPSGPAQGARIRRLSHLSSALQTGLQLQVSEQNNRLLDSEQLDFLAGIHSFTASSVASSDGASFTMQASSPPGVPEEPRAMDLSGISLPPGKVESCIGEERGATAPPECSASTGAFEHHSESIPQAHMKSVGKSQS